MTSLFSKTISYGEAYRYTGDDLVLTDMHAKFAIASIDDIANCLFPGKKEFGPGIELFKEANRQGFDAHQMVFAHKPVHLVVSLKIPREFVPMQANPKHVLTGKLIPIKFENIIHTVNYRVQRFLDYLANEHGMKDRRNLTEAQRTPVWLLSFTAGELKGHFPGVIFANAIDMFTFGMRLRQYIKQVDFRALNDYPTIVENNYHSLLTDLGDLELVEPYLTEDTGLQAFWVEPYLESPEVYGRRWMYIGSEKPEIRRVLEGLQVNVACDPHTTVFMRLPQVMLQDVNFPKLTMYEDERTDMRYHLGDGTREDWERALKYARRAVQITEDVVVGRITYADGEALMQEYYEFRREHPKLARRFTDSIDEERVLFLSTFCMRMPVSQWESLMNAKTRKEVTEQIGSIKNSELNVIDGQGSLFYSDMKLPTFENSILFTKARLRAALPSIYNKNLYDNVKDICKASEITAVNLPEEKDKNLASVQEIEIGNVTDEMLALTTHTVISE